MEPYLPHQRGIVQLVERWTVGRLDGHHVAVVVQTGQRLSGEVPAEERGN